MYTKPHDLFDFDNYATHWLVINLSMPLIEFLDIENPPDHYYPHHQVVILNRLDMRMAGALPSEIY